MKLILTITSEWTKSSRNKSDRMVERTESLILIVITNINYSFYKKKETHLAEESLWVEWLEQLVSTASHE